MPGQFAGKVAIVTGGSSEIGKSANRLRSRSLEKGPR